MVNRVRRQSHEQPISWSWLMICTSYSSFHDWTRWTNWSRVNSVRRRPSSARMRFSTTVWVAMPAWSVPGIHSVLNWAIRL